MLRLKAPQTPIFLGTHHVSGNGSAWTLAHEAELYILAMLVGLSLRSLTSQKFAWISLYILAIGGIGATYLVNLDWISSHISDIGFRLKFLGCFSGGALCFVFQDKLAAYRKFIVPIAAVLMTTSMFFEKSLELAIPLFLPALLIGIGTSNRLRMKLPPLRWDLSYGLYIYAWPIQKLWLHQVPNMSATSLFFATSVTTALAASISWNFLEKPALQHKFNA